MDPSLDHQALFPMFSLSPTTRQTTRALQEIQAQRPSLLVVEEEGLSVAQIPTQVYLLRNKSKSKSDLNPADGHHGQSELDGELVRRARHPKSLTGRDGDPGPREAQGAVDLLPGPGDEPVGKVETQKFIIIYYRCYHDYDYDY